MKESNPIQSALDIVWRRPLTPVETDRLRESLGATAGSRDAWEEEQLLSALLERWPEPRVPDRFTLDVLEAVERKVVPEPRRLSWWTWLRWSGRPVPSWAPGVAVAAALLVALPAVWLYRHADERTRLAASVIRIAQPVHQVGLAVQLPGVEIFRDFEVIDRMRQLSALADEELLASLEFSGP
jgi:hypothetical protein